MLSMAIKISCWLSVVQGLMAMEVCIGYGAVQENTDLAGDLLAKIQSASSSECCSLCNARSDCEGFVFHLDQCYLKKDLKGASFKQDAMSAVKAQSSCTGYTGEMNDVDMAGDLLAKVQSSDASRCCAMCDYYRGCEGYVFHLDQCYLKKDLSNPSQKHGAVTRIKFSGLRQNSVGTITSEKTPTCAGYSAPQTNTDTSGELLAKIESSGSADCCSLCELWSDCEGFVFHLDQCYLKKHLAETSYKQDAISCVKVHSSCTGYTGEMKDVDMSGTLLAKIQSPDKDRCCGMCDSFEGCEGYVFHLDQCYLKKDLSMPAGKPGAVTRIKFADGSSQMLRGVVSSENMQPTCAGYRAPETNTDVSGDVLAKIQSPGSDECCSLCEARPDCEGYVFHLDQCYLKKNLAETSYKQNAVTRVKEALSTCAEYTEDMRDVDMSGTLLAKIQSQNKDRCCAMCDSLEGCEGYVFHLDQCYLKKDLTMPIAKSGAVTRIKFLI